MREAVRAALGADRSPHRPRPRALLVVNCAPRFPRRVQRAQASALATNVPTALLDALDAAWSAGDSAPPAPSWSTSARTRCTAATTP